MSLESVTQEWMKQLDKVGALYTYAAVSRAGLLNAHWLSISALFDATRGGLMYGGAATGSFALTAGVPIATMVGVWVALGSGYYEARQQAKKYHTKTGFMQGFIMGLLKWEWNHVVPRFGRQYIRMDGWDEQMDVIRVEDYNRGLKVGFLAGKALPNDLRKAILSQIRKAGGVDTPKQWAETDWIARRQQISYVIELAVTAEKYRIITPE